MPFFKVTYKGLWLGGVAVVKADDEQQAREAVERDDRTIDFADVTVTRILVLENTATVLHNDNGDY